MREKLIVIWKVEIATLQSNLSKSYVQYFLKDFEKVKQLSRAENWPAMCYDLFAFGSFVPCVI